MWEVGRSWKVETGDFGHVERGVEEVGGHGAVGLHPERRLSQPLDTAEGLCGANDVVDAHAVESLAEEIEATEDVVALAGVSGP